MTVAARIGSRSDNGFVIGYRYLSDINIFDRAQANPSRDSYGAVPATHTQPKNSSVRDSNRIAEKLRSADDSSSCISKTAHKPVRSSMALTCFVT